MFHLHVLQIYRHMTGSCRLYITSLYSNAEESVSFSTVSWKIWERAKFLLIIEQNVAYLNSLNERRYFSYRYCW